MPSEKNIAQRRFDIANKHYHKMMAYTAEYGETEENVRKTLDAADMTYAYLRNLILIKTDIDIDKVSL